MESLALAAMAAIPNFAGFIFLTISLNRVISKLFAANKDAIAAAAISAEKRIIVLETKVHELEKQIAELRGHVHDLAFVFSRYSIMQEDQAPITKELDPLEK